VAEPVPARAGWGVAAAFAVAVGALKLLQHASLQTQAYDLGVFANVVWNTLHGRPFLNSMTGASYLADHFSPLLALLCPVFLLWKDAAALLLVQTLALALAVPAVHRLAARQAGGAAAAAFAVLFALSPYVHRVSRYDFHDAAFAVPLFLWALAFWDEGRFRGFWACLGAATLLREDMPLATAGVGIWIAFLSDRRGDPRWRLAGLVLSGAALSLFALEVAVWMPSFGPWRPAAHSYGNLGGDLPSILRSLADPATLWRHTLGDPARLRSLAALLAWTGGLALLAPGRLFLAAAPVGLNLLSGNPAQSGFQLHYAATALPFLFYAAVHGAGFLKRRFPPAAARLWLLPAALAAASSAAFPRYFAPVPAERRRAARELLSLIPPEDAVQASNNLFPHVALRERAGLFPDRRPARWVLLDREMTGFHPPASAREEMEAFARVHAARRAAAGGGFELYRAPEAP
jgi:uncharacterized membrane protein